MKFMPCPWWLRQERICLQCRRPGFDLWVRKTPLETEMATHPVFLPGKSHGQRSLVGCSLWGRKESHMTEWLTKLPGPHRPVALLWGDGNTPLEVRWRRILRLWGGHRWGGRLSSHLVSGRPEGTSIPGKGNRRHDSLDVWVWAACGRKSTGPTGGGCEGPASRGLSRLLSRKITSR